MIWNTPVFEESERNFPTNERTSKFPQTPFIFLKNKRWCFDQFFSPDTSFFSWIKLKKKMQNSSENISIDFFWEISSLFFHPKEFFSSVWKGRDLIIKLQCSLFSSLVSEMSLCLYLIKFFQLLRVLMIGFYYFPFGWEYLILWV